MKKIIFFLTLIFLISSCKKDYQLEEIDSDILVSVVNKDSEIEIKGETEREYSCSNYTIINSNKNRKNEIYIHFKKVQVPDICLTSIGPAKCTIGIGKLANGDYPITFELNNKKTKGNLKVGSTTELILDSGGNVKPK